MRHELASGADVESGGKTTGWYDFLPVLKRWQIGCAYPFALFLIAGFPFTISWWSRVVLASASAPFFVWAAARGAGGALLWRGASSEKQRQQGDERS